MFLFDNAYNNYKQPTTLVQQINKQARKVVSSHFLLYSFVHDVPDEITALMFVHPKRRISTLQENTPNSDGGSDGLQCRRTFVTDFRPISDENKKFEVVGISSAIFDEFPR